MNIRKSFQLFGNSAPKLVVAALPVWLGLTPLQALAVNAVGGNSTNGDVTMPPGTWTLLRSVQFFNPAPRYCMAVGSADIKNPPGNVAAYLFTLTHDQAQPPTNDGDERTVEFLDAPVDNTIKEVTTTQVFASPAGNHVIRWLGAPAPGASPATLAYDSSLSVVCTDVRLTAVPIVDSHPEPTPPLD